VGRKFIAGPREKEQAVKAKGRGASVKRGAGDAVEVVADRFRAGRIAADHPARVFRCVLLSRR
jgi:hypothetical protein